MYTAAGERMHDLMTIHLWEYMIETFAQHTHDFIESISFPWASQNFDSIHFKSNPSHTCPSHNSSSTDTDKFIRVCSFLRLISVWTYSKSDRWMLAQETDNSLSTVNANKKNWNNSILELVQKQKPTSNTAKWLKVAGANIKYWNLRRINWTPLKRLFMAQFISIYEKKKKYLKKFIQNSYS